MNKNWKKLTKKKTILIMIVLVVLFALLVINDFKQTVNQKKTIIAKQAQAVKIMKLGQENNQNIIKTIGTVQAQTALDVIALSNGTLRSLDFKVGDLVVEKQKLATIQNNALAVNYSNAQTSLANTNSLNQNMLLISEERVRQAENGVAAANKTVDSAKLTVHQAGQNLQDISEIQNKAKQDLETNAITGYYNYLNILNNKLDKVDYILKAEGDSQLPNIGVVLGAKDSQSLIFARNAYWQTKKAYNEVKAKTLTADKIKDNYKKIIIALKDTKNLLDDVVQVLDNTISDYNFPQTALNAQKDIFTGYRSSLVNNIINAEKTLQSLENIDINNQQKINSLTTALATAKNQLKVAQINAKNALSALDNAKQSRAQQKLANQSSLDSVRGQVQLLQTQINDLNIKAPLAGKIIEKYVEAGAEIRAGQKIARIAQDQYLKIEVNLNAHDIYNLQIGQLVKINNNITGQISLIDPAVNPITKKIRIEITVNKQDTNLIIGSFVDVSIPEYDSIKMDKTSFFIPLQAIIIAPAGNYVFIAKNNQAKKVLVETGEIQGKQIQIISGLKQGDKLIIEGAKLLNDGDRLIIN